MSQFLNEGLIALNPPGVGKTGVIQHLVQILCQKNSLGDPTPYMNAVQERERLGSTTLDTGLSIPHARAEGLKNTVAVLGLLPQGVTDSHMPDVPIRLIFLFFSPVGEFTQHLHLLAKAAALFQNPSFVDTLLSCTTPRQVLELIHKAENG